MVPFFPKTIANKGLTLYFVSLVVVSVAFMSHAIGVLWMVFGAIEVLMFFLLSTSLSQQWQHAPSHFFVQRIFWVSFLLRVAWVFFSYYFYTYQTGQPFEFEAADSAGYHLESERTRIYTQYYRDHEEEHPVLKRARALYAWCEQKEIWIADDDFFAGNISPYYRGLNPYVEWNVNWIR